MLKIPLRTVLAITLAGTAIQGFAQTTNTKLLKDKNLTYIVANNPGSGCDAYARLIGYYMEKISIVTTSLSGIS